MNLLSPFAILNALSLLDTSNYKRFDKRFVANFIGSLFLILGYILATIALYYYLSPLYDEPFSLFILSLLYIVTGFFIIILGYFLKRKEPLLSDRIPALQKTLSQIANNIHLSKIFSLITPKAVVAFLVVSLVTSLFSKTKQKVS